MHTVGATFSVPDFFTVVDRKRYRKGSRLNPGKEFKKLVDDGQVTDVVFIKKTSSDWAVYLEVYTAW